MQSQAVERILQYTEVEQEAALRSQPLPPAKANATSRAAQPAAITTVRNPLDAAVRADDVTLPPGWDGRRRGLTAAEAARVQSGSWPEKGEVELCSLSLRYRPGLPLALRDVSITITAGSTVAVVGRTGAGKSSLILALFRLVEATEPGAVRIDGIPTSALGLHELRSQIAIIPQEPTVFSGSFRSNLDPFSVHRCVRRSTRLGSPCASCRVQSAACHTNRS